MLTDLHHAGHDIALVVTQPDRRRRRGGGGDPSPVKQAAGTLGLAVATPDRAGDIEGEIRASGAALAVVVAFGQILPARMLDALPGGWVNLHFSLLPRWRGAAPVERAVLAGDEETGVCLMRLEAGLDTGPVYACQRIAIGPEETAGDLRSRLADAGSQLLLEHIDGLATMVPAAQEGEPTYAAKLTVEEFRLDFSEPAGLLERRVRAGNPKPGAWTTASGRRLKVLRARAQMSVGEHPPGTRSGDRVATGSGDLLLVEVQPEGKPAMAGAAWAAGFRGDALGDDGA